MRTVLSALICSLVCASAQFSPFNALTQLQRPEAGGCSSAGVTESASSLAAEIFIGLGIGGAETDYNATGQKGWSPTTNGILTKVRAKYLTAVGTISGFTYEVRIYVTNVCERGTTLIATSTGVTGNNGWSGSSVDFNFASTVCVSTATHYNVVFIRSDAGDSATDYLRIGYGTSTLGGMMQSWKDDGAPTSSTCTSVATTDLYIDLLY